MLPVRLAAGLGLAFALVVVAHVVGLGPSATRYGELFSILHVLGFTALTVLTSVTLLHAPKARSPWVAVGIATLIVCVVAVVSESAQTLTSRNASVSDLVRDVCGIVTGSSLVLAFRVTAVPRIGLVGLGAVVLYAGVAGPGEILVARALALSRMPSLASFDRAFESPLVRGTGAVIERVPAPGGWPLEGNVARIVPAGAPYAGLSVHRFPQDWTEFDELTFLVAASADALTEVTVRVHDARHDGSYADRFNRVVRIGRDPVRVHIPLKDISEAPRARPLNLSQVEEVIVFSTSPEDGSFIVDDLRLQ